MKDDPFFRPLRLNLDEEGPWGPIPRRRDFVPLPEPQKPDIFARWALAFTCLFVFYIVVRVLFPHLGAHQ
jgi:hypothetical protein